MLMGESIFFPESFSEESDCSLLCMLRSVVVEGEGGSHARATGQKDIISSGKMRKYGL